MKELFIFGNIVDNEGSISDELFETLIQGLVFQKSNTLQIEEVVLTEKNQEDDEIPPKMKILGDTIYKLKNGNGIPLNLRIYKCVIHNRLDFIDFRGSKMVKIETLTLNKLGLNDSNVEQIIQYTSNLEHLKILSLNNNNISTEGVKVIIDSDHKFQK